MRCFHWEAKAIPGIGILVYYLLNTNNKSCFTSVAILLIKMQINWVNFYFCYILHSHTISLLNYYSLLT